MSKLSKILADLDSDKYIKVDSLGDYKNLPIEKRSKKFLFLTYYIYWYKRPYALPINDFSELFGEDNGQGWSGFKKFVKQEFPIQAFFRETIPDFWLNVKIWLKFYWFREFYYNNIQSIWYPANNNGRKVFKRQYQDLGQNLINANFAIVRDLVEQKSEYNGVENLYAEYLANPEFSKNEVLADVDQKWHNFRQQLFNCYKYIVDKRPILVKNIEGSYPELGAKGDYETLYGALNRAEAELEKMDSAWLKWIVDNRNFFWT